MRNIQIVEEIIPRSDKIFVSFGKVNYEDSFCLSLETNKILDVDIIIFKLINSIPKWFELLLYLRNVVVSMFGLKTGKILNSHYNQEKLNFKQDQYFGDFYIILKEINYLVVELKDKHLDFRFAFFVRKETGITKVSLRTIVKLNNIFGKMYFFLITPFHRLIVPNILKRLSSEI